MNITVFNQSVKNFMALEIQIRYRCRHGIYVSNATSERLGQLND
jgi:hypothetical protein